MKITTTAGTTVEVRTRFSGETHLLIYGPEESPHRIGITRDGLWSIPDFPKADIGPDVLRAIAELIEEGQ